MQIRLLINKVLYVANILCMTYQQDYTDFSGVDL